jgi:hypothetical protein
LNYKLPTHSVQVLAAVSSLPVLLALICCQICQAQRLIRTCRHTNRPLLSAQAKIALITDETYFALRRTHTGVRCFSRCQIDYFKRASLDTIAAVIALARIDHKPPVLHVDGLVGTGPGTRSALTLMALYGYHRATFSCDKQLWYNRTSNSSDGFPHIMMIGMAGYFTYPAACAFLLIGYHEGQQFHT